MLRPGRWVQVMTGVLGGLFVVAAGGGCQSHHGASARALACDKCNVDVDKAYSVPSYDGPRHVGYLIARTPECGHCEDAEQSYAESGEFDPQCHCGGMLRVANK